MLRVLTFLRHFAGPRRFHPLTFSPILPKQPLHPDKLFCVRSHQRQFVAQRLPRDQYVIRPDGLARHFQRRPHRTGPPGVLFFKRQQPYRTRQKSCQVFSVFLWSRTLGHDVPKLIQDNCRDPNLRTCMDSFVESRSNRCRLAFVKRNAGISIKQIVHRGRINRKCAASAPWVVFSPFSRKAPRACGPSPRTILWDPKSLAPAARLQAPAAPAPHLPRTETPSAAAPPGCVRCETVSPLHSSPCAASSLWYIL